MIRFFGKRKREIAALQEQCDTLIRDVTNVRVEMADLRREFDPKAALINDLARSRDQAMREIGSIRAADHDFRRKQQSNTKEIRDVSKRVGALEKGKKR